MRRTREEEKQAIINDYLSGMKPIDIEIKYKKCRDTVWKIYRHLVPKQSEIIINSDGTASVKLTKGKFSIIDKEDIPLVEGHLWNEDGGYAVRSGKKYGNGKQRMHRVILGLTDKSMIADHINNNGLDNRKLNLRSCSRNQNAKNRSAKKNGASKYLGVSFRKKVTDRWVAHIYINGKNKNLGSYDTQEEAAIAYDKMAKIIHGEFANLNFK